MRKILLQVRDWRQLRPSPLAQLRRSRWSSPPGLLPLSLHSLAQAARPEEAGLALAWFLPLASFLII